MLPYSPLVILTLGDRELTLKHLCLYYSHHTFLNAFGDPTPTRVGAITTSIVTAKTSGL